MSTRTLWKIKVDVHQIYNLRLSDSNELPDPYIAASLEMPQAARQSSPVQRSSSKSKTSSGTFNAVMLFIANIYDLDFDKVKLSVRVHNGRKLTEVLNSDGSLIGSAVFSLSKIRSQPKHWIPREWVPITGESSPGETRGYVNVSIGVFGPGDDVPSQLNDFQVGAHQEGKDVISRVLLEKIVQTPETNFSNCMLIFNLLRAENLSRPAGPCSSYIKVSFVGQSACTRVIFSNANPAWTESVRIPVLVPTWDQWVLVDVYSREGDGRSSDSLLGSAIFDFGSLYKLGIQPTWFNLYSSPSFSMNQPALSSMFGGEFSGRVLISAGVSRSSDFTVSVVPFDASSLVEPSTEELVVFIDIYELSFQDEAIKESEIPDEIWLQVQFGPNTFDSPRIANSNMTCVFGETIGRFEAIRVHLPVVRSMAYEMVLSVMGQHADGSKVRMCHSRLCVDRFFITGLTTNLNHHDSLTDPPEWYILTALSASSSTAAGGVATVLKNFVGVQGEDHDQRLIPVASLLANISAFKVSRGQFPDRPPRIRYELATYELRISVHQACNVMTVPGKQLPSACCRVTLAGASARTQVIPETLFPAWNEGLRIVVDLPTNPSLRPDVLIEVLQDSEQVLGTAIMKSATLRSSWTGSPSWYKLRSSSNSSSSAGVSSYILCSAVLVLEVDGGKLPIPSPLPQRGAFSVDLLILGVRLMRNFSIERFNQIEVSWGRHRDRPARRVTSIRTQDPVSGEGGQFNFFQPALLDLDLPVDATFQEFLEIRLFEQQHQVGKESADWWGAEAGMRKTADAIIGYGYLHLNPHYSWISEEDRKQCRELFMMKTNSATPARQSSLVSSTRRKDVVELEYIEREIESVYGISVAKENCIDLLTDTFSSVETEKLLPEDFIIGKKKDNKKKSFLRKSRTSTFFSTSPPQSSSAVREQSKFMTGFVWDPLVDRAKSEGARGTLDTELEAQLDKEQLPFLSVPLVALLGEGGSESSSFTVVGYLKVRCRVREKSADSSDLLVLQKAFMDQYLQSTRLVCRLYMLRAEGIVPSQSLGADNLKGGGAVVDEEGSFFLWVRNVVGDLIAEYPNCSIKDEDRSSLGGKRKKRNNNNLNPDFSKCFQLPCSFPENSLLHIEVHETRERSAGFSSTTTFIGSATVDLEDRWFHPQFQSLQTPPIETWTLRSQDGGIPKGKIKFWLEIMDQNTAMGKAIETLPSPQCEDLQVRVVLWRTRAVVNPEGEEHCHQGISAFMQDLPQQDSDTHYGSMDGLGTFNWRFVFNPTVPSDDTTIRFTLQHRPLTSIAGIGYVALGEVILDLNEELAYVRKTRRGIDLPRNWVPLSHPAFLGKTRGMIEIQIRVLTSEEARAFPVGLGRDSPNTDPFLDGSDPHLVQHRNALANSSMGRSFSKFVEAMRSGLRWATILFIVGSVISGIVALVVFLIYIGVIKVN